MLKTVLATATAAKSLQSCLTLCDPIDSSPPGSPVPGILQARTLEWIAISFSNAKSVYLISMCVCMCVCVLFTQSCPTLCDPMDYSPPDSSVHGILQARTRVDCHTLLQTSVQFSAVTQSCPILCSLMDCSPPDSSVHGILQARILEWVAMPFPRGSSQPWDQTQVSCFASRFFTSDPPGKPCFTIINTIKTNFLVYMYFFLQ